MKSTTWLCPVLTLLCVTKLVYTAQRGSYGGYPLDNMDSSMLQNDYFLSKRNKPSLSIVNPLDVLRQRLLLEIARRQMKENTRQVELNRAILKNVGKRMLSKHPYPLASTLLEKLEAQQRMQQESMQQQHLQQQPYELELIPTTLIFDYLQQQQQQQQQQPRRPWLPAIQFDNNNINDAIDEVEDDNRENDDDVNGSENDNIPPNGIFGNNEKHSLNHVKQLNNDHASTKLSTNEHETITKQLNNRNNDTKRLSLLNHHKNDLNNENLQTSTANDNDEDNDNNSDYQIQRYLYHLHKNHLTRK